MAAKYTEQSSQRVLIKKVHVKGNVCCIVALIWIYSNGCSLRLLEGIDIILVFYWYAHVHEAFGYSTIRIVALSDDSRRLIKEALGK